ncbi:hypothetical protein PAPYR_12527 [Paratrimastix pyriformis]|uniref:Uncharacterized protein n=1 Tax=Paratrimastix pyriformis TaxID=342808 RepID=A0ABQ8U3C3_9EUKA|nr:hypothetical protein PAPYR_12527 [Paratrimastix pyriformis]
MKHSVEIIWTLVIDPDFGLAQSPQILDKRGLPNIVYVYGPPTHPPTHLITSLCPYLPLAVQEFSDAHEAEEYIERLGAVVRGHAETLAELEVNAVGHLEDMKRCVSLARFCR